jgi:hypothetical protein
MTERKPREISFTSWIDRQISEAHERGAFDNLPGAGKPLPKRAMDTDAWIRDKLDREGVPAEEMLPVPLRLRKEAERVSDNLSDYRSEREVREVVRDLNRRILEWRRIPVGPPVVLRLVDEEATVTRWRDLQPRAAGPPPPAPHPEKPARRRWWRRREPRS